MEKKFKKIYIGGKITGLSVPEYRKKFEKAKKMVQSKYPDAEVIIPTDLCPDDMNVMQSFLHTIGRIPMVL